MFRPNVCLQITSFYGSEVTFWATEGLLSSTVLEHMRFQITRLGCRVVAHCAMEGSLPTMHVQVYFQISICSASEVTFCATERLLLTTMLVHVFFQNTGFKTRVVALYATEWLVLTTMLVQCTCVFSVQ